jgi:type VI secretion system secreted protein VgrG
MAENLKQDDRIGRFNTPLGKDELVLVRFDGTEGLSELFEYRIEALSEKDDLNFDRAIGKDCQLSIKSYGQEREFNGVMVEAQWLGMSEHYQNYRVILRPWLWLLSHTSDCRIFQDKKAPEIIKKVFEDRGFSGRFELKVDEGSYPKLEYCVQYRETDLNFVSRLMEQHGIYYFFEHKGDTHKLILIDSKSKHQPVPKREKIPYKPVTGDWRKKEERIVDWVSERRFRTGKVTLKDYHYEKSNTDLKKDKSASESYARANMEYYDYPGKYKEHSDGEFYAKIQLESEQAFDHHRHGNGDAVSLFPGGLTELEEHPTDSQNIKYLIVRANHSYTGDYYRTGGRSPGSDNYHGSYEFIPSDRQFRAPIVTPKPRIYGIQTAKVVTEKDGSNEEIDVKELTEIFVRFHWMREEGDKDGKQRSCKLRCAQLWSGKNWGGQFIPRVGQEVVVEFLEGDPDRPLVVGTVYNDQYKPPYDLPAKKTQSGIKSDSTKNGGGGYNELMFEDQKGSELVRFHAQKDLNSVIENEEKRNVGTDQSLTVGTDQTITIGQSQTETIGMNQSLTIGGSQTETIAQNQTLSVGMSQTVMIGMAQTVTAGATITLVCGASSIIMTPASIVINSPAIAIVGPTAMSGPGTIGTPPVPIT